MDLNIDQKKDNTVISSLDFADVNKQTAKTEDTEIILPDLSFDFQIHPSDEEIQ